MNTPSRSGIRKSPGAASANTGLPVSLLSLLAAAGLLFLGPAAPAATSLAISEFMAANSGFLSDQDGDSSDWIELHNASTSAVSLAGWHLTDDPDRAAKWTFPTTNLPPDGYLLVFASGKDRAVAGAELHTNFKLGADGEYLALVEPDGFTIVQAYSPVFPPQSANRSFGIARQETRTALVLTGAAVQYLIPTNGALGTTWIEREFDAGSWSRGVTGLGFDSPVQNDTNALGLTVLSVDFDDDDSGETGAANTETGFTSVTLGANPCVVNGLTLTLSALSGGVLDDRDRTTPAATATLTQDQLYDDFIFVNGQTNGNGLRLQIAGLRPRQDYYLKIWSFDSGSTGSRVSDWAETSSGTTNWIISGYTFNGTTLPSRDGDDTFSGYARSSSTGNLIIEGRRSGGTSHGVFLNALQLTEMSYRSLITTDLGPGMSNRNASAFVRIPFVVSNAAAISSLALRVKYDDGFIAWINGQWAAARNAPASPAWNSTATASHPNAAACVFEEILLPVSSGLLIEGTNLLAIQGLNLSATDPDWLLLPELDAVAVTEYPDRYFTQPTPGQPNNSGALGLTAEPEFSVWRGFYSTAFQVSLSAPTPGSEIRWTTNGSSPTPSNGLLYTSPIPVWTTTLLRAAAFRTDYAPSDVVTHTYLFPEAVLGQSNSYAGYPATWQASFPADYAMDTNVVNHPRYGQTIRSDLRALPSLSIVTEHDGLWGPLNGIYNHATSDTEAWERPASVELFNTDGLSAFAVNCGLRMQGNASRDNVRTPKHSFRLLFKSQYGPAKLEYPWFPGSAVSEFDNLVLRACFTDSWPTRSSPADDTHVFGERYRPQDALYLRDVWMKDSFAAMGHLACNSTHVHLYLNGLYWGLYNPCERADASFFSHHLGGPEDAWDVLRDYAEVLDGSKNDWTAMMSLCNAGITSEAAYQSVCALVDVPNLIDYMLLHLLAEAEDWPHHNWYAAHRRATNGWPATPWIFLPWDQEIVCDQDYLRNRIDVSNDDTPARIYSQLRAWPEFRREFGDRVQRHLFNAGALTPGNNAARFALRANSISNALVCESARWGDAREFETPGNPATGVTFTRDEYWVPELQKLLTNWFPRQQAVALDRLRAGGLYPWVGPPAFNQCGGDVPPGFSLELSHTNAAGVVYYTIDGADPRAYGSGTVAPTALPYSAPRILNSSMLVRARVLSGANWSALVEAGFRVPADLSRLQLSELFYQPPDLGAVDGDEFEFVELRNLGEVPMDLSGFQFTNGITFTFSNGTSIRAGDYLVLARNPATFTTLFPGVNCRGAYTGKLDNSGERITLVTASGELVFSVAYGVGRPWPVMGGTNSLQRINIATDYANPIHWAAGSPTPGGPPPASIRDSDNDAMPDVWESAHGLDAQFNDAAADPDRDGMDNLAEFQLGTDPQLGQHFFRLGADRLEGARPGIVLDFYSMPARSYVIEQSTNLPSGAWNAWFTLDNATASGPLRLTNTAANGPLFYRLIIRTAP